MTFKFTAIQQEAWLLATRNAGNTCYLGGSRSGKSVFIQKQQLDYAMTFGGSRHATFRETGAAVKRTIFNLTLPQVMDLAYPGLRSKCDFNGTELTCTLPNGSVILMGGLLEHNQDRVLGNFFDTIWVNEATEIPDFGTIETLWTRLSGDSSVEKNGTTYHLKPRIFYDLNPTSQRHWAYKAFVLGIHPETEDPWEDPEDFVWMKMNPHDNAANLSKAYLDKLNNLSRHKRQRFLEGDWQTDTDRALFDYESIKNNRRPAVTSDERHRFRRIYVSIDPAGSTKKGSDETGIIVVALGYDGHCYVLADHSGVYRPEVWAKKACDLFHEWGASRVIAETNYGGEMVPNTIRSVDRSVTVKPITAKQSKGARADPVATRYANGEVHHCGTFDKLEAQMEGFTIDFDRNRNGSPDRMDALVHGVAELLLTKPRTGGSSRSPMGGYRA